MGALSHIMPSSHGFKLGDRVRAKVDVERFPHFIVKKGDTGIISDVGQNLGIKMDRRIEGSEEWHNKLWYHGTSGDLGVPTEDLEVIRFVPLTQAELTALVMCLDVVLDDVEDQDCIVDAVAARSGYAAILAAEQT